MGSTDLFKGYGIELGTWSDYKLDTEIDDLPKVRQNIKKEYSNNLVVSIELAGKHPANGFADNCTILLIHEDTLVTCYDAGFGRIMNLGDLDSPLVRIDRQEFKEQCIDIAKDYFNEEIECFNPSWYAYSLE